MPRARARTGIDEIELRSCMLGLTALVFMALVLSGCNTAEGVGEDLSAAGDAITEPFQDDEDEEPGA